MLRSSYLSPLRARAVLAAVAFVAIPEPERPRWKRQRRLTLHARGLVGRGRSCGGAVLATVGWLGAARTLYGGRAGGAERRRLIQ